MTFVVRMKSVKIANSYCPEEQTKQGDGRISLRLVLTSGWPKAAGMVGIAWKIYFDSPILWLSPSVGAGDSKKRPGWRDDNDLQEHFSYFVDLASPGLRTAPHYRSGRYRS
jgi:hypothetical protein